MEKWISYIWFAIVFFVMGQVCLKYDKLNALTTCCYFTIAMGIVGLLTLGYISIKRERDNLYQIMQSLPAYYFSSETYYGSYLLNLLLVYLLFVLSWQGAKLFYFLWQDIYCSKNEVLIYTIFLESFSF